MTHPPPDPEGRRQRSEADRLRVAAEKVARQVVARLCSYYEKGPINVTRQFYLVADIADQLVAARALALEEAAARLDAALAVKDEREAVERAWALVRELRGE